jgi:hypothetical protein
VVRELELYHPDIEPREPLSEERDLPFGHPGEPAAAAFVLIERLTGVTLSHEWLLDERRRDFRRSDP